MGEATLSNSSELGLSSLHHRPECSLNVMASIPIGAPLADGQGSVEMRANAPLGEVRANALLRSIGAGGPDRQIDKAHRPRADLISDRLQADGKLVFGGTACIDCEA
jgi:hypothetical protein